jgi:hypothetical protein
MKSAALLLALVATASAYAPLLATRAVGTRAVGKKAPAKKSPFGKKAAPAAAPRESKGYPSFAAKTENFKPWAKISGGGNKAPPQYFTVPDLSNPAKQIDRDPAFYAAAAKTRLSKAKAEYVFEDGLTDLERRQRATIPTFLSGAAKSNTQADTSAIAEIEGDDLIFGLSADRFQLLFIAVFGLFTLVGCLSGSVQL